MTVPHRTLVGAFRLGDVALKIWALGEEPHRNHVISLEKLVDPAILKEHPALAYTYSPADISAIRKLTKEAEDAVFNFQSILMVPQQRAIPAVPDKTDEGETDPPKTDEDKTKES
jgi:hypothetical protein